MKFSQILGIDVGGSGIKGAPIDISEGKMLAERYRIPTPLPASPDAVAHVIKRIVKHFKWEGPVGVGFPSVVLKGVVKTATNIDKNWIGVDAQELFSKRCKLPVLVVNDADAAGLAEIRLGAGKKVKGTVLLLTIGTGIGSALFTRGCLVANSELGHIFLDNGLLAEKFAADSVRQSEELSWSEWGERFNKFLKETEKLFSPELIIVGGGVSKRADEFMHAIDIKTKVVMANQRNEAGLIGAALAAVDNKKRLKKMWKELKG
jgi:polyphosphate glucokinase